jgi:uncharacterized protein (DUF2062 family)
MKLIERRAQANAAFADLRQRERAWSRTTRVARAWCMRHRAGVIVGGGVATGLATSLLPIAPLMRLLSALAGTASLMLEGPFLRFLTASHREATSGDRAEAAAAT